jgi:uncharacterized protein (TIGR01777 family)
MGAKVVVAGGSGFIGSFLSRRFAEEGLEVVVLSRSARDGVAWDGKTVGDWARTLEGAELVLNLAGRSVDCRYNKKNKKEIFDSRTDSTQALGKAIQQAKNPPRLWINSSTATIYRHAQDRPMDEATGEIGSGFSVEVARQWEKTFFKMETPGVRKVALRTAIVLGKNGGVLKPFKNLVRLGLGGIQGDGKQRFSWIHEEDLFLILQFLRSRDLSGVVNCAAPGPVTNQELMKTLRLKMGMPFGFPAPRFLLGIGAWVIRTETELILKSRWVVPGRLTQAGYRFQYPALPQALDSLLKA